MIYRAGKSDCQVLLLGMFSIVRHLQWNHEHSILAESTNTHDVYIEMLKFLTLYSTNVQLSLESRILLTFCLSVLCTMITSFSIISTTTAR